MPDENGKKDSTSALGQIAQAVADLFKSIVSGIPPGRMGIICRFLIIIEVLLTLFGVAAMVKSMHDVVWGCLIAMIAFGVSLMFCYGTPSDANLAAGQDARAEQILGSK
jgi:phosphatidylglycerophosphatase A